MRIPNLVKFVGQEGNEYNIFMVTCPLTMHVLLISTCTCVLSITNHRSAAVMWWGRRVRPRPWIR